VRSVEDWLAGPGGVMPTGGRGSAPSEAPPDSGAEPRGSQAQGAAEASTASSQPEIDKEKLIAEARSDPGVVLATRILGGDVVAVRPDGGSTG